MFPKKLKNDTGGLAKTALIIIIVLVMLSASTLVIVLYQGNQDTNNKANRKVVTGDTVKVDYIGKLADGRVFDTSLASVANDAAVPKSLAFTLRSNSSYTPLSFTVGGGTLITGFNNAVIGMKNGETKTVELSPSQAYGNLVPSKLTTFNLTENKNVYVNNISLAAFKAYYSVTAVAGMTIVDPIYKWPVNVLAVDTDADKVKIQNAPIQGQNYLIYQNSTNTAAGWNITIDSVNTAVSEEGQIVFHHDITNADSGMIKGVNEKGTTFILDNVDTTAGTARMNANTELIGKTLTFTITLVTIV
jgi:FKBP-type peptidyl-prolyl cis-trans isomerase 2